MKLDVTLRLFATRGFPPSQAQNRFALQIFGFSPSLRSIRAAHDGSTLLTPRFHPACGLTDRRLCPPVTGGPRPGHPGRLGSGTAVFPAGRFHQTRPSLGGSHGFFSVGADFTPDTISPRAELVKGGFFAPCFYRTARSTGIWRLQGFPPHRGEAGGRRPTDEGAEVPDTILPPTPFVPSGHFPLTGGIGLIRLAALGTFPPQGGRLFQIPVYLPVDWALRPEMPGEPS